MLTNFGGSGTTVSRHAGSAFVAAVLTLVLVVLFALPQTVTAQQRDASPAAFVDGLASGDANTRAASACALAAHESLGSIRDRAVLALSRLLDDNDAADPSVCEPYRNWGRWGGRENLKPLQVGREAARALAAIYRSHSTGDTDARIESTLLEALADNSGTARENAAWALGAIDHSPAVPQLIALIKRDTHAPARTQAAWALGAIGDDRGVEGVVAGLGDDVASVRTQAAWASGAIGSERSADALLATMGDADAGVREQAAWALGAIGADASAGRLARYLDDPNPGVREQVAWALGAIGHSDAVDGLLVALRDDNPSIRTQAAWALGAIGDRRAEDALMELHDDPVKKVRKQAAWALSVVI